MISLATMQARIVVAVAIAAVICGGVWVIYRWGYDVAAAKFEAAAAQSLAEWHAREADLIAKAQDAGQSVKVIYRDRIKTIEAAEDNCLDAALPADIVDSLR